MILSLVRRCLCTLLLTCTAWAAPGSAGAESGIAIDDRVLARLRRPNVPIPANGALLFMSGDFTLPVIEVRDPDGVVAEGELHEVGLDTGPLYAWKPAATLATGTHEVTIRHPESDDQQEVVNVEVVEPFAPGLPPLETAPGATWQASPQHRDCCTFPVEVIQQTVCFLTSQEAFIRVQPGFLSAASQAVLNQYLFRVMPAGGGSSPPIYRPLEHPAHEALFHEAADSYCIEVRALNIATREESVYSGLESCASHDNRELGTALPVEVDLKVLAIENGCFGPPPNYEDEWCTVNDGACNVTETNECELYKHICEGGPLPDFWLDLAKRDGGVSGFDGGLPDTLDGSTAELDASEMPTDPVDASFGPSAHDDGCAVISPHARSSRGASLGTALVLLMLSLRRLAPRRR